MWSTERNACRRLAGQTRCGLLSVLIVLSLVCLPGWGEDDYASIERRKQRLDQLEDLLNIRRAELELERLRTEHDKLRIAGPTVTIDAPIEQTPPAAANLSDSVPAQARLIEIFDELAIVEHGGSRHELRRGSSLHGWKVSLVGRRQVRLVRNGSVLQLHFQRRIPVGVLEHGRVDR